MTLFLWALLLWVSWLVLEALRLERWRRRIPHRVCVTGSRGKSTVVRMLTAALRDRGFRVLGKTTGSEARLLLPEGGEGPIRRRGVPSILEQVGLLREGDRAGVDVVVAEIMSIHAENHRVESGQILRPHLVLCTNLLPDHPEAGGRSTEGVASLLALDVPRGATVLIPPGEGVEGFAAAVAASGGRVEEVPVQEDSGTDLLAFPSHQALVRRAVRHLTGSEVAAEDALPPGDADPGELRVREYARGGTRVFVAGAFAANDPGSTRLILEGVRGSLSGLGAEARARARARGARVTPAAGTGRGSVAAGGIGRGPGEVLGILTLREDRGDRTVQWLEALRGGFLESFRHLFVLGFHAGALQRRLARVPGGERVTTLGRRKPGEVMDVVLSRVSGPGALVFGFGNYGGMGQALCREWARSGGALILGRETAHGT